MPPALAIDKPKEEPGVDRKPRNRTFRGRIQFPPTRLRRVAFGGVTIDLNAHTVNSAGRLMELTRNESAILAKLISNANRTVPRSELAATLAGAPLDERGAVRHFIENLRRKVEPDPAHPQYLVTQRAIGYRLQIPRQVLRQHKK
jgi:DNA-binding response OmpR family regulator